MDYFGLINEENPIADSVIDSDNELATEEKNIEIDVIIPEKCLEPNCTNMQTTYGTFRLPYCSQTCMKHNVEYLFIENAKLKGEISAMEFIISQYYESFIKPSQ